jgi:hypothetical protein
MIINRSVSDKAVLIYDGKGNKRICPKSILENPDAVGVEPKFNAKGGWWAKKNEGWEPIQASDEKTEPKSTENPDAENRQLIALIIQSGLSEDAIDEQIAVNDTAGITASQTLKQLCAQRKIVIPKPESKEERQDRMARQRDELVEKQIKTSERLMITLDRVSDVMEKMCVRLQALETAYGAAKIVGGKN